MNTVQTANTFAAILEAAVEAVEAEKAALAAANARLAASLAAMHAYYDRVAAERAAEGQVA